MRPLVNSSMKTAPLAPLLCIPSTRYVFVLCVCCGLNLSGLGLFGFCTFVCHSPLVRIFLPSAHFTLTTTRLHQISTRRQGKALVAIILQNVIEVFQNFHYVREFNEREGNGCALVFAGHVVDDKNKKFNLVGVDFIKVRMRVCFTFLPFAINLDNRPMCCVCVEVQSGNEAEGNQCDRFPSSTAAVLLDLSFFRC